jgi:hypothetical protein
MIEALLLAATQPDTASGPDCSYDLDAMLALSRDEFDQTLPDGGWRGLHERGCYAEAAELIREWRHEKRDHASILYTHEGQMRAYAGQTEQAIALLRLTYKPAAEDAGFGWNHYMDGTIAFLEGDRVAFDAAKKRLAAIGRSPPRMVYADGRSASDFKWPPNLHVLEAFERCWGESYAYANTAPDCFAGNEDKD